MRYPEFLQPGGRIGLIAPSFGCTREPYLSRLKSAIAFLEERGYTVLVGPNVYEEAGVGKSNTPQACADEIMDFFTNDRADLILSVGGGETMCEDLAFVDFDALSAAPPRYFMGYSDNTNLSFTLPTLCDTAAVYAPCATSFGLRPLPPSLWDTLRLITGESLQMHSYPAWQCVDDAAPEEEPLRPYFTRMPSCQKLALPGKAFPASSASFSGRLLGGCLDCLINLCGTKYDRVRAFNERYVRDGVIWFLESCDLTPLAQRRAFWQLSEAGWFDNARGFLLGRPGLFDYVDHGLTHEEAARSSLERFGVPIVLDTDLGHLPPMMPLIAGALAEVGYDESGLSVRMRLD